ncbi:Cell morphogenesis protein PAG1, partial [Coemansia asiatica]
MAKNEASRMRSDPPSSGRRANSFDAATKSQFNHGYGDASDTLSLANSHNPATTNASANASANAAAAAANASAAAAAVVAAANANNGGSGSMSQMRRRRLRLSLAQIFRQVARQLSAQDQHGHSLYLDEQLVAQLISYVRETKTFLSESSVQWEWEHQSLRIHFCGLVEALYYFISFVEAPLVWAFEKPMRSVVGTTRATKKFTHETRNGLYQLFERWCSLGRFAESSRETQQRLIALALEQTKDTNERSYLALVLEEERRLLELVSVRAMAVLCRDGLQSSDSTLSAEGKQLETGGPREKAILFAWISDALNHHSTRVQLVGQKAVEWTVRSDPGDATMVRVLVQLAYGMPVPNSVDNCIGSGSPGLDVSSVAAEVVGNNAAGAGAGAGADDNGVGASGSNGASGLGLVFGSGDVPVARASVRQGSGVTASARGFSLSSDRVVLGYLRAVAAIVSPSSGANETNNAVTMRGRDGLQARVLTQRYVGWLIPLILVQLRSDQHRIRRQALVLLRTMCLHLSVDISCVYRVDELGPSIVSDIPAIASRAAVRLTEAVALAFAGHSVAVLMETVRQIHAHSAYGPQFAAFIGMVRPWLVNIVLRQADSAVENNDEDMSLDRVACLDPVALSRESLLVLQCMLYMTIKTGHDSMSSMQELWLALAGDNGYDTAHSRSGGKGAHNIWLIIRYLTGLLVHSKSHALLGYMRRISVFLTRSLQGPELVKMLVDESMQPSAANKHHKHQRRLLVSTGGLAMFYLGAISYEQPDVLAAYQSLAVLPSSMILLANPERWVRDAARTVLVNLVASERARCTHVMHLASDSASASASASTSSVEQSIQANDAAHSVLSVLRGDECMTGFGNLDEEDLDGTHGLATTGLQKSRSYYRQQQHERQDSRFSDDDDDGGEDALHGWSPVSISAADYLERGGSADAHKDQADTNEDQNKQREQHQHQQQQQRVLHGSDSVRSVGSSSIDAADSSVVADVADFAAAITQSV